MQSQSIRIFSLAAPVIMLLNCQTVQNPEAQPSSQTPIVRELLVPAKARGTALIQASEPGNKLAEPAWPVTDFESKSFSKQLQTMRKAIDKAGTGISATQTGFDSQIMMIRADRIPEGEKPTQWNQLNEVIFVNPVITRVSSRYVESWQQCLSALKHGVGRIKTWKWIQFTAFNEHGLPVQGVLDGEAAIAFQHSFRHLLGGTLADKTSEFIKISEFLRLQEADGFRSYTPGPDSGSHLLDDYNPGETIREYAHRKEFLVTSTADASPGSSNSDH